MLPSLATVISDLTSKVDSSLARTKHTKILVNLSLPPLTSQLQYGRKIRQKLTVSSMTVGFKVRTQATELRHLNTFWIKIVCCEGKLIRPKVTCLKNLMNLEEIMVFTAVHKRPFRDDG